MEIQAWLETFLSRHGGIAGSIHWAQDGVLTLAASVNIPPPVVRIIETVPKGKGMAGLAWERGETVSTCNLKTDQSGDVKPGAKAVDAQAALAIPVWSAPAQLRGVVGIAFMGERDFSSDELAQFEKAASDLPDRG